MLWAMLSLAVTVAGTRSGEPAGHPRWALTVQAGALPGADARTLAALRARLAATLDARIELGRSRHALGHWLDTRTLAPEAIVIEQAQFVGARLAAGTAVLAAQFGHRVSYALVTVPERRIIELDDLRGAPLALVPSPDLGALALHDLLPGGAIGPLVREARDAHHALALVRTGRADAAMLEAGVAASAPELDVLAVTEAMPGPGIVVSAALDPASRARVSRALVAAGADDAVRAAFARLGLPAPGAADPDRYRGFGRLLRGTWPDR